MDDICLGGCYRQNSRGGDEEEWVWRPILPAQKPISVVQDRLMSLEAASQVGNSDVLRDPNVAETALPIRVVGTIDFFGRQML